MPPYRQVSVDEIIVPQEYQRPLDEAWVGRIVDNFRSELFHPITVSDRNGAGKVVVAGQHRLHVARELNQKTIGAFIHTGLTPQDEAELFVLEQKGVKNPTRLDIFRARVASGPDIDPAAYEINEIVQRCGFKVGPQKNKSHDLTQRNNINAVGALEELYSNGVLEATLQAINSVWRGPDDVVDYKATVGELMRGFGYVMNYYEKRVTPERLERLSEHAPKDIIRRAQGRAANATNVAQRSGQIVNELRSIMSLRGGPSKKVNRPKG
jgi:hypothetical protein